MQKVQEDHGLNKMTAAVLGVSADSEEPTSGVFYGTGHTTGDVARGPKAHMVPML